MDDRLATRQTMDHDVEETAEIAPDQEEQSDHHKVCQRNDPLDHHDPRPVILLTDLTRAVIPPGPPLDAVVVHRKNPSFSKLPPGERCPRMALFEERKE
jgi:hypothetical protein